MGFIGFILLAAYFSYNLIQAGKAQVCKRLESPFLLLFLALPLDIYKKIFKV